ncbi:MAG: helix-turn-helix domain-containing protein [Candidatus Thiothrix singaporensis]|uniref:Helix-turn-helix domain-containing protein n=1 Tax=Candidatus Thiothrix singaporensis TaxID=2799669 RepID=A0A7L6AY12_9GAMM|nr:MAG: helix-turn-helix domain-containing protein [Candidatus Thiothrix singaporensis]
MSAIDLAKYVQARMEKLDLTVTSAAQRSGISRQTWHKLMRADIKEAKISTLIRVANALKITVPDLIEVYFHSGEQFCRFTRHNHPSTDSP